jgi:hypothetical protein
MNFHEAFFDELVKIASTAVQRGILRRRDAFSSQFGAEGPRPPPHLLPGISGNSPGGQSALASLRRGESAARLFRTRGPLAVGDAARQVQLGRISAAGVRAAGLK